MLSWRELPDWTGAVTEAETERVTVWKGLKDSVGMVIGMVEDLLLMRDRNLERDGVGSVDGVKVIEPWRGDVVSVVLEGIVVDRIWVVAGNNVAVGIGICVSNVVALVEAIGATAFDGAVTNGESLGTGVVIVSSAILIVSDTSPLIVVIPGTVVIAPQ
jgi:hypothetical protein